MPRVERKRAFVLAAALAAAGTARAALPAAGGDAFVSVLNGRALASILAQIKEAARLPQTPPVVPVVDFGDRRAARYRFRRREEVFAFDARKQPVHAGWETWDIVETSEGSVERLIAVDGDGPGLERERETLAGEARRLSALLGDAARKASLQKKEREDQDRLERMVAEFPRALRYSFAGFERDASGRALLRESFESNDCSHVPHADPCFAPRSQEARIYEGMKGSVWVRAEGGHLARFAATFDHDVRFGWGVFNARAKRGGSIAIALADLDGAGRRWVIVALEVHLTIEKSALASLFSGGTERDHDNQTMSGFAPVGPMSYDDGIRLLLRP